MEKQQYFARIIAATAAAAAAVTTRKNERPIKAECIYSLLNINNKRIKE